MCCCIQSSLQFNSIAVTWWLSSHCLHLFCFFFISYLFVCFSFHSSHSHVYCTYMYTIYGTNVYEENVAIKMWSDGNLKYFYSWFNSFAHFYSGWLIELESWACDELNNQMKTNTSNDQEEWTEKRYRNSKMMKENNVVGFHFKCKWLPEILAKARTHEPLNAKSLPNIISDEKSDRGHSFISRGN